MSYSNFDGNTGKIIVSGYRGVLADRHRAISVWLRTTQSSVGTICWWGNDLEDKNLVEGSQNRVRLINGRLQLFGLGSFIESASQINDGNWHHALFNWTSTAVAPGHEDFSTADVYIDNVLDNGRDYERTGRVGEGLSLQAINTLEEEEVVIGARPGFSGIDFAEFYEGDMDEFAIYNVVVPEVTISGIYNEGTAGVDLKTLGQVPALQLWYTMGDDVGDSAPGTMVDQAFIDLNGRDGTVFSGVLILVPIDSAKATTPPTLSLSASGFTVVIPVPSETRSGDFLLAVASFNGVGGSITSPAGWTTVLSRDASDIHWVISSREATSSEPANYTWTFDIADVSRSGCMIAINATNATIGDSDFAILTGAVPSLTNSVEGSILVAFAFGQVNNPPAELAAATFPLIEQTQHTAKGSPSTFPEASIVAIEQNLSVGTISGRGFTHSGPAISPDTVGIIVEDNA